MTARRFPEGFLWGAATSSHQVEGGNASNDWWAWEAEPGNIHDGTRSGDAAGWWTGRAEEDLARARSLGQNAHRMSLEWSRLETAPGRFDADAFARYAEILVAAKKLGLTTMVTLNHFTLPAWATRDGSWLAVDLPERFGAYARRAIGMLGEHVDLWATLNEPNVLAYMGYAGRAWPPGLGDPVACFRALGRMLMAHARAYEALHAVDATAKVGIVLSLPVFDPASATRRDRAVARTQDWAFSGALLHALDYGLFLPPLVGPRHERGVARSFDWLGLNYYGRYRVAFDRTRAAELFGRRETEGNIRTEHTDWGEPWPEGLTRQLLRLSRFNKPLYVTENGIYDNDDSRRPEYLTSHVRAVHAAIEAGADVRGYFAWSLVDNFEWAEGWSTHFGLYALDRETQARTARGSAEVYAAIARNNAVEDVGEHDADVDRDRITS